MIKKIEKIAKGLMVFSLSGLLIACILPEPASGAFTMKTTVSSTMVSCTTPLDTLANNSFGAIDNAAVSSATTSTTTVSSSGTIYLKIYDDGTSSSPGLYFATNLIESPWATMTDATATLSINMEGYGIMASTTSTNLAINIRYNKASSTNIIGALEQGVGNAVVVASSTNAVSGDVVNIDYKVSVSLTTPGGIYQDIITLVCSSG